MILITVTTSRDGTGKYSKRRRSNVAAIIDRIVLIYAKERASRNGSTVVIVIVIFMT